MNDSTACQNLISCFFFLPDNHTAPDGSPVEATRESIVSSLRGDNYGPITTGGGS